MTNKQWLLIAIAAVWIFPLTNIVKVERLNGAFTETPKPHISLSSWFDASYQKQLEQHISERTLLRNLFIRVNNQIDFYFYSKANAHGIIVGKEDYLYEEPYILSYLGRKHLGEDTIKSRVERLKRVEEHLNSKGIKLLTVFAAGKARFYPEYIPDSYIPDSITTTDYEVYLKEYNRLGLKYIDFNKWFVENKNKSEYKLYPKTGIHWSIYTTTIVADSICRTLEKLTDQPFASIKVNEVELSKEMRSTDDDIEKAMNLMFDIEDLEMAYPNFEYELGESNNDQKVLTIGDSFFWDIYLTGLSRQAMAGGDFWYYFKESWEDDKKTKVPTKSLNFKESIEANAAILLITTEPNLSKFPFGFIEKYEEEYFLNDEQSLSL